MSLFFADHKQLSEQMAKCEETGEKRVDFFVALATVVGGGLATWLTQGELSAAKVALAAYALLTLVILGEVVLLRLLKRNRNTDQCKLALDDVRERILGGCGWTGGYAPFGEKRALVGTGRTWTSGGLVYIAAVMNSSLLGACVGAVSLLAWPGEDPRPAFWGASACLVLSVVGHFAWLHAKAKSPPEGNRSTGAAP
ncbi:MAG: hypothetical protein HYZ53_14005 [Planctomycetes bacterium]|nr:hypothetical protein [Planctomycetota bacterium]